MASETTPLDLDKDETCAEDTPLEKGADAPQSPPAAQPLLLVTTVDIGDGKADRIEVRQGDDPLDVARAFVTKHGLPAAITSRLALHLEENLAKVAAAQRAGSQMGDDAEGLEVFHRLYQQAIQLRSKMDTRRQEVKRSELESMQASKSSMSWISSEMMRDRGAGPFSNYGQMLYAESLESLARKREKADRVKAQREVDEVAGATFHPEISRLAQNMWSPAECAAVPAWQRLSKVKLTKAQERLEMLRREKEEAEVRECTFKPAISGRSERLMTERSQTLRSLNVSAHQQLYQDAVRRQQKQADYQHWYPEEVTFQPKLNESAMSREFLRRSLAKEGGLALLSATASPEERHSALVSRLYASYQKLQAKLAEARSTLQGSVDVATGERLFHPKTGRAPNAPRGSQPVFESLYSLGAQQEAKARAAAQEVARRAAAEAGASKSNESSQAIVRGLQQKRFRQIFDFLDAQGAGAINLLALMDSAPEWLDDLDDQVRVDLEAASQLLAKRCLKHNDSGRSEVSSGSFFMPPPPALADMPEGGAGSAEGSAPPTPGSAPSPGLISFSQFCALMDEALTAHRGPRAYLAPSPPRKHTPAESHKPQINERSKRLANRLRPKDTPAYEVLYAEGSLLSAKLSERRAAVAEQESRACTFAPTLVSAQLVKEGRVMRELREGKQPGNSSGSGSARGGSALASSDAPDSLQALAASVMASTDVEEREPPAAAAAAAPAAAGAQDPAECGEQAELLSAGQPARPAAAAAADADGDEFEGSEEQAQVLELEREVAEMARCLEEATSAAAERRQSNSDRHYLSQILGLTQESLDCMAPAISRLQVEVMHSRSGSVLSHASPLHTSGHAAAAQASSAAGCISSFSTASKQAAPADSADAVVAAACTSALAALGLSASSSRSPSKTASRAGSSKRQSGAPGELEAPASLFELAAGASKAGVPAANANSAAALASLEELAASTDAVQP